jgi:hypothetical protein
VHSASWGQLRSYLKVKVAAPGYKTEINDRGNPLRWPRDTLYPQKLALTSPTSGGRVGSSETSVDTQQTTWRLLVSCSAYFFDSEDGGEIFLRNVCWLSTDYTALYPRTTAVRTSNPTRSNAV